jgi:hypothetical protein
MARVPPPAKRSTRSTPREPRTLEPTAPSALRSKDETIPVLRPDLRGYVLEQEVVDGFADRADLSENQRVAIAKLAERFSPDGASDEQKALLAAAQPQPASDLGLALAADEDQLTEDFLAGALADLPESAWRVISNPAEHGSAYPLTSVDLQKLTGATYRQIRYWNEAELLPSQVVDGERRFFATGLAKAFMLFEAEKYQVAAANAVRHGGMDARRVLRLVGASLVENARHAPGGAAAGKLAEAGQLLMRHCAEIVDRPSGKGAHATPKRGVSKRGASKRAHATSSRSAMSSAKRSAKTIAPSRGLSGAKRTTPRMPSASGTSARESAPRSGQSKR